MAEGRGQLLACLSALGLVQALIAAILAWGMRALFNELGSGGQLAEFRLNSGSPLFGAPAAVWLAAAAAGAAIAFAASQMLLRQMAATLGESLGQRYAAAVRSALLAHLYRMTPLQRQRYRHGHLMSRLTGDLTALRRWVGRTLAPVLVGAGLMILTLGVLAWLAPLLTAAVLLLLSALGAVSWVLSARLEQALRAERKQRWALAGQVGERLSEAAVVQANAQAPREMARLQARHQTLHDVAVARARWAARLQALPQVVGTLAVGGAAAWGAWRGAQGGLSAGALAGMLTLLALTTAPLRDLLLGLGAWRDWRVSREKLESFLANAPAPRAGGSQVLLAPHGHLLAQDLRMDGAFEGVEIDLPAGGSLAISGPSGSGKSALLRACAGLATTDGGLMSVDGQVIAECTAESVARRVALVSADLPLLRGSIAANLRYRCRDASQDALWLALERVGLAGAIRAMPRNLQTPVREGGRNLPASMRMRLCLARALMDEPAVALVDDFDLLLEGDTARDEPLAQLLSSGGFSIAIVTAREEWRARCTQTLRLDSPDHVSAPERTGPLPACGVEGEARAA